MSSTKRLRKQQAQLAATLRVPLSVTDTAIFDFFSALDCSKSLAAWLLYINKEHQQLVDLDIDPLHYNSCEDFRDSYAAWSFLSKADFLKIDVSKEDQAFAKFFKFEAICKETNTRFKNLSIDPNYHGSNVWLLSATSRKIQEILGTFVADEFVDSANWGPGVTTLLKGESVSAINKFHCENGITRDLYSLVGPWFQSAYPRWSEHLTLFYGESCFNYQVGNSIVTVPKNSKTDRVIAVEPGLNLWFQKGIGKMIRRRLLRRGVDLRDQTLNQELARLASENGLLATVDFSSASDSISKEVVRELLPPDWFQLLDLCRTPLGIHNGEVIRWEKFSSMGNGFTFELESLIFYAAALAVKDYLHADGPVSVYGDDVILPSSCYDLFASFSKFLGFTVNLDKSFASGLFRESCGSHYWDGRDCKPIFLKQKVQNVQSIYKLANNVRALAHRRNSHRGCDARFARTWRHLFKWVPKSLRFCTSLGYGDTAFFVNFDEARPSLARHGIEGFLVTSLLELGVNREMDSQAVLLARLKGIDSQKCTFPRFENHKSVPFFESDSSGLAYGNQYTLRGRTKLCVKQILVPQWYNLGSWS